MSTHHGDPQSYPAPTAPGTGLFAGLLLAGTIVLLVVAVKTFPAQGIPPLSEMEKATAAAPRVLVDCQTTWMGDIPSETCYWTLRLDDGRDLSWPWAKTKDSAGQVRDYLRANGPISVRFWNGTLFQIELHDGAVYLDYDDVHESKSLNQRMGVILGSVVAAMSLLCVGLELRYLQDPYTEMRAGELGAYVGLVCLGGAMLVAVAGTHRTWTGVVGLALFAAIATAFDRPVVRRALAPAQ